MIPMFAELAREWRARHKADQETAANSSTEEWMAQALNARGSPPMAQLQEAFTTKPKLEVGEPVVHTCRAFGQGVIEKIEFTDQEPLQAPGGGPCWVAQVRWDDTGKTGTVWAAHLSIPGFTFDDDLAGGW
jgi:hypothetical protein